MRTLWIFVVLALALQRNSQTMPSLSDGSSRKSLRLAPRTHSRSFLLAPTMSPLDAQTEERKKRLAQLKSLKRKQTESEDTCLKQNDTSRVAETLILRSVLQRCASPTHPTRARKLLRRRQRKLSTR
ncbi:hypothetical protein BDZ91DRAFT_283440 [Kalaharituber pfeilii]|nr:hypothetical protein BDZ91DRAFT_283440 [Kalaharituber pfeilii]